MVKIYGERESPTKKRVTQAPPNKFVVNEHSKHILNKDLQEVLTEIVSPVDGTKHTVSFRAFDDKTELYQSLTLDIMVSYKGDDCSLCLNKDHLSKFFEVGYQLVAFHADKNLGLVITLHKMPKGKKK